MFLELLRYNNMSRGDQGYRTNHSLRAAAASRLYQSGVDEQLKPEVTGYRPRCPVVVGGGMGQERWCVQTDRENTKR